MTSGFAILVAVVVAGAVGWTFGRRGRAPPGEVEPPPRRSVTPTFEGADEVWIRGADGWSRLARSPDGSWAPVSRGRDTSDEIPAFPPNHAWVRDRSTEPAVRQALGAWSEAGLSASRIAWVLDVPAGDRLLDAWCRRAEPADDPTSAFARWFVAEVGIASRRGLVDRATAERRDVVSRSVLKACARVVQALDPGLDVEIEAPLAVGLRDHHRWLVDGELASRLDNPRQAGLVRPIVVLRPLLRRGDLVLLEGEVA